MKELQIGDEIYMRSHYHGLSKGKVTRVTKTRAFSGEMGFNREYSDEEYVYRYPRERGWNTDTYQLGNDRLKAEYEKQRCVKVLSDVKWTEHDIETLVEVMECIGEKK